MSEVIQAALHLVDVCVRYGRLPAGRGAQEGEIEAAKKTFADLGFPLPSDLIEVYSVTTGIVGISNHHSILSCPIDYDPPEINAFLDYLDEADLESAREGVLWLGQANTVDLIIDRDGQCATDLRFRDDGTVELINPAEFRVAFLDYVQRIERELLAEFESA